MILVSGLETQALKPLWSHSSSSPSHIVAAWHSAGCRCCLEPHPAKLSSLFGGRHRLVVLETVGRVDGMSTLQETSPGQTENRDMTVSSFSIF